MPAAAAAWNGQGTPNDPQYRPGERNPIAAWTVWTPASGLVSLPAVAASAAARGHPPVASFTG